MFYLLFNSKHSNVISSIYNRNTVIWLYLHIPIELTQHIPTRTMSTFSAEEALKLCDELHNIHANKIL